MSDLHICKLFQSIGKLRMTKLEIIITVVIASLCVLSSPAAAADPAATNSPAVANSQMIAPLDRVATTDKGKLTNPLVATPEIVAEGRELYQANTCGACHGGNGKGAHGPSLANGVWVYGNDDDTIFRLVTLGSEELLSRGYSRGEKELVAGPMPGLGSKFADEQDLWKILVFIRSFQPTDGRK